MTMKRIVASVILVLFASNLALAEVTDYEKKLQYRREKIAILVKTHTIGETSGYSTTDTWGTTISPEAGYSYTYSSGTTRTNTQMMLREVSDWVIIRGGIREMSDVEFLTVTGNRDEAAAVQARMDERSKWNIIGVITGIGGLIVALVGSNNADTGTITAGSAVSLIGFFISSLNFPRKHYIAADYALEAADKYNIGIKKELGLPIDFE